MEKHTSWDDGEVGVMSRCIPESLPEEIAIVVSWVRFTDIAQRQYELCLSPQNADIYIIDRDKAMELIRRRRMKVAHETDDGKVYDSADRSFYMKYKGWFSRFR